MLKPYTPPPDLLAGRTVLVTGAGDGLGRAAALAFARHGATVILLGRATHKLEQVYDQIEREGWPQAAIYPMNLEGAAAHDYAELADRLEQEFGKLDGLLHNAASLGALTPIELYDPNLWHQVMVVNLYAPFLLTQACLPLLKHSPDASVIFTSDAVGRKGRAYWGAYGVSKAGLEGLAQILADELETNTSIRVNTLNPGPARTRLRGKAFPGQAPNDFPAPEDLMWAYLYLMGPDSRELRGQQLDAQAPDEAKPATPEAG
jgi:NAD(P)-dependent dehydrogenase (short-subunit alcohol dehydrogenase family)